MIINKLGISNKNSLFPDVNVRQFKPYIYKEEELSSIYPQTLVCKITTTSEIKYENGVLSIDSTEYKIGDKSLLDLQKIINSTENSRCYFYSGYEHFQKLKCLLLDKFNNTSVSFKSAYISPTSIEEVPPKFLNIKSELYKIDDIKILSDSGDYIKSTINLDKIYFNSSTYCKIYVKYLATEFNIVVSFGPKVIEDSRSVSNLINYCKDDL